MNLVSILSAAVFVLYLELGLYVFFKNPTSPLNRWFFLLAMCFSLWSIGSVFFFTASDHQSAMLWYYVTAIGWGLFPALLIRFNTLLANIPQSTTRKNWLFRGFFIFGLVILFFLIIDPGGSRELITHQGGYYMITHGRDIQNILLYTYLALTTVVTFVILISWRKNLVLQREIVQFNLIFYPLLVFLIIASFSDILLPALHIPVIPRMGHIFSIIWVGGLAYGILRLRFFSLTPSMAAEKVVGEIKQILFFCDLDNRLLKTNTFTELLLRAKASRIIGRNVKELFAEDAQLDNFISWAYKNGYSGPAEINLRSFHGEMIPANLSFAVVKDSFNDTRGLMIYGQDNREAIKLRNEIVIRQQIEKKLRSISEVLDARVKERNEELAASYKELQLKMTERLQVEEQIKSDISEKEVLINEIHNRVKNNMNMIISLINTHKGHDFSPKVSRKFRELAQRVQAILMIHDSMYLSINYSDVDFSGFLKKLVDELVLFYKRQGRVKVEMQLPEEVFLDIDYAIPLGIVVNELVSNALNHGFSDHFLKNHKGANSALLKVDYRHIDGFCEVEISDNGKGLPKNFNMHKYQTNGLPLSEILVKDQINGSMDILSEGGTRVKISFPSN